MNPAFFERNSPNKMEPNFHKIQWIKIQIEKIHSNKSVCRNLLAQQNPNHFCCSEIQEGISTGRSLSFGSDPPCSFWSCLKPWALSRYFPTLKPPKNPKKAPKVAFFCNKSFTPSNAGNEYCTGSFFAAMFILFLLQAAKLELVSMFRCFVQCVLANTVKIVFLRREEQAVQISACLVV